MHSDSHFLIGHSHRVCEDYALSGITEDGFTHYAIISDGCSDSKKHHSKAKTDLGARILAHCAVRAINNIFTELFDVSNLHRIMGKIIINNAQRVIRDLGLPEASLDATLIISIVTRDGSSFVFFYGDGTVAYRKDDLETLYTISYPSNAPYYLSYLLNNDRNTAYFEEFGNTYTIERHSLNEKLVVENTVDEYAISCKDVCICDVGDIITIMSDGVDTFEKLDGSELPHNVVADITDFKRTAGEYVTRQMIWLANRNTKQDIVHKDDFSMASICL